jgi:hypothetical protein
MILLRSLLNAAGRATISESNFEIIDAILAGTPSVDPATNIAVVYYGPPQSGAWAAGDLWLDVAGTLFRCTVAGTSGTWVQLQPLVTVNPPLNPTVNYLIQRPDQKWAQFYYDGAAWQPVFLQP